MVIEATRSALFCLEIVVREEGPQTLSYSQAAQRRGCWSHKELVGYSVSGAKGVVDFVTAAEISSKVGPRGMSLACPQGGRPLAVFVV